MLFISKIGPEISGLGECCAACYSVTHAFCLRHLFYADENAMLITSQSDLAVSIISIHLVYEELWPQWSTQQEDSTRNWLSAQNFRGERNKLVLVPDAQGQIIMAVGGLGQQSANENITLWQGAALSDRLPDGVYQLVTKVSAAEMMQFALGWEYGQYRFDRYKKPEVKNIERKQRVLQVDPSIITTAQQLNDACTLARDLVNTPAGDLHPRALAQAAVDVATKFNATVHRYAGDELLQANFPAVHAVGRAGAVAPELVDFEWGSEEHSRVTLVGKGVCFDTGGLDIKPSASMLLMKKDMGGAACVLALSQLIMQARLPIRLRVIIPAVENAIAGNAFRPGDVLDTRAGLHVEVGNTDAEGRLILCDGLALADADAPELLIDLATLTGAARVALGPEVPALFTRDQELARELMDIGMKENDPMWQLPLWAGYDDELSSKIADLNNASASGFSGSITAALFLQRFVSKAKQWIHLDLYAWNAKDRPGRPVGAEAQCVRALFAYLQKRFANQ